jgi:hypothetical protein
MPQREFESLKALREHAARCGMLYVWEFAPEFALRQQQLSPEQYEIVSVHCSKGVRRLMVFAKGLLKEEWAQAPLRQTFEGL